MHIINRKKGEKIKVGDAVIVILSTGRVKIGIEAPPEIKVERVKLGDKI